MVLRHILGSCVRSAAKHKVREAVVEAAREDVEAAAEQAQRDDPDEPCRVGVVFALGIEAGGLAKLLDRKTTTRGHGLVVRRGRLKDRQVALITSGAAAANAARATEALIAGHRPQWVFSAGFAGGLQPQLKHCDILMADHLVDASGGHLKLDLNVDPDSLAAMPGVHVGRLLTVERIVRLPQQKRSLGEQHDAMAVDMETFAVAEVCRQRQVPFLAVRVVHDTVDDELPPDIDRLLAQKTLGGQLGAATGAVWRRPGSIKDMYHLRERAVAASDRLAKFLAGMIEQL